MVLAGALTALEEGGALWGVDKEYSASEAVEAIVKAAVQVLEEGSRLMQGHSKAMDALC